MTNTLNQASQQWMSRPHDERFASLLDMQAFKRNIRDNSESKVISSRKLTVEPFILHSEEKATAAEKRGLVITGPNGSPAATTHWSFGQLCSLASPGESPANYFRKSQMPAPMIADCLNYNLRFTRGVEDVGVLLTHTPDVLRLSGAGATELRSVNGPNYGRVYDADVVDCLVDKFGDGVTGHWRVPGEFGEKVAVTKANTTLYASDRDMFVFLADEDNRIEMPDRRAGKFGSFARGFFIWNSEVGKTTLGAGFFLFDYVCCNRIVWGADQYTEVRIRHTSGAPDRWLEEVTPVLEDYSKASAKPVLQAIEDARSKKIDTDLDAFLAGRFGKSLVPVIKAAHETEEGRPIETLWDVTTAATAYARSITNTDKRLEIERAAGDVMKLAA
jgi:hypothetical protein